MKQLKRQRVTEIEKVASSEPRALEKLKNWSDFKREAGREWIPCAPSA